MKKVFVSNSFDETQKIGFDLAQKVQPGVIALYGNLGFGKTTFAQGFAKGLGINKRILSPTFIIVRSYKIKNQKSKMFYHIDLYRTQNQTEIQELGIKEIIQDSQNIVLIEWAEKMKYLLPKKRIDIYFEYVDENRRKMSIVG